MHNMPDYGFYTDVYAGSVLAEDAFRELIRRAADWLEGLERCYRVESYGPDSRKMALCALAETLHSWRKRAFLEQTAVGNVSVRYEKSNVPLQRLLLQSVAGYLEVYRGVGS